jgi:hypothetical protein
LFLQSINTNAQAISIEPFEINRSNPAERGWFIYKVQPGTVIEGFMVLRNDHPTNTSVELFANDGVSTPDGNFALASNDEKPTLIGSWIELSQRVYDVDGQTNLKVPFKINVPQNAAPGEYAGGLSVVQVQGDRSSGGPIGAKIRVGARIYLTVEGNLTQNVVASGLTIINPKTENFVDELNTRGWINKDNMALRLNLKQNGNIYSKFVGETTFKLPDGKEVKRNFTKDVLRNSPTEEYYLETGIPYQVGKTEVTMKYQVSPTINNKDGLNSQNDSGEIKYELDITQADIDELTKQRTALQDGNAKEFSKKTATAAQKSDFNISGPTETERNDDQKADYTLAYVAGVTISLIAIAGIIAFVYLKKNKKEEKRDSTSKSKKE